MLLRSIIPVLLLPLIFCQSAEKQQLTLAERLVSTLPELPSVIRGGINGDNEGFQKIISNVLGDGLISQLVTDPLQVAGEVLPELGLNRSELGGKDTKLFPKGGFFNLLSQKSPQKSTTEAPMLVDGVAVDFDEFIRKHNLENQFSTKKPKPTTPPPPSAEKIADEVYNKLRNKLDTTTSRPQEIPRNVQPLILPPLNPNPSGNYNFDIEKFIQSQQIQESQRANHFVAGPPGAQSLTEPRAFGVIGAPAPTSYEEINRLKEMVKTYEEMMQTKDFFDKRKQLQVLESQLTNHRNQIQEQIKLEETLREKERELQEKKKEMEKELHAQLKSWNLTNLTTEATTTTTMAQTTVSLSTVITPRPVVQFQEQEIPVSSQITTSDDIEQAVVDPSDIPHVMPSFSIRRQPPRQIESPIESVPMKSSIIQRSEPEQENCVCEKVSMNMMKGHWNIAFATEGILRKIASKTSAGPPSLPICSNVIISDNRPYNVREARLIWEFRKSDSSRLRRVMASITRGEDRTMSVAFSDAVNDNLSSSVCILKSSKSSVYEYVLLSTVEDSCREAVLMVRDPNSFFNQDNHDLTVFLKERINAGTIEKLKMVPFTHSCID